MKTRILMVDDEPDAEILFRQHFRREMRKAEYEFLFAQSAQAALEILESEDTTELLVVLSDINMPGMTGIELLDQVKQRWPHLPVIMITAYGDAGTQAQTKAKGADQLISKPVDFSHLKSSLVDLSAEIPN